MLPHVKDRARLGGIRGIRIIYIYISSLKMRNQVISLSQTGWFILTPSPPLVPIPFFLKQLDLWSIAPQYKAATDIKVGFPQGIRRNVQLVLQGLKTATCHFPSAEHTGRATRDALKGHSECHTSHWHIWPMSVSIPEAFLALRSALPAQRQPALGYHCIFHLKETLGSFHS